MRYTIEDYKRDVEHAAACFYEDASKIYARGNADDSQEEHPELKTLSARRGAYVAAAGKRLKASVALDLLHDLKPDYDMTITLAFAITERFLGRGIKRSTLIKEFGTTGRTAADKSDDFAQLDEIENGVTYQLAQRDLQGYIKAAERERKAILGKYRQMLLEQAKGQEKGENN